MNERNGNGPGGATERTCEMRHGAGKGRAGAAALRRRARALPAPRHAHPREAKAIASVVAALFEAIWASSALANPTGAQVVAGGVTVNSPSASQMNITQSTPNAIVNWNTFSIGAGEAVNIAQPSVSSALLNRVVGNDPSSIAGRLSANGRVFLVNPAGVIFAPGSSVNVGSLVASTLGISNADFLAGNFHFVGKSPASVVNAGSITAADGGTIALLGGTVTNSGMVAAKLGTVAMGAGSDVTLDFAGDGLTTLKINSGAANAFLGNTGTLAADGGTVVMSAQTADALAGTVINQQGIVRAQSLAERDGHIVLDGGTGGETLVSGTLDASGGAGLTGGQVDVTGYNVALLSGANVNASGAAGGGSVRFGGGSAGQDPTIRDANAVWMDPNAQIYADALTNGNGGHIVAYGTTAARIYGALTARGGAQGGNGGLIETSGHYVDVDGATIDASAPRGQGGIWTMDPYEVDIVQDCTDCTLPTPSSPDFSSSGPTSQIYVSEITGFLNSGTSVTVSTVNASALYGAGDINVQTPIEKTAGPGATLSLSASGGISIGYDITSTSGPLSLVLDANVGGTSPTSMVQISGVTINTNGGAFTIGDAGQAPVDIESSAIATGGGAVNITGTSTSGTGVAIGYSSINAGGGEVTLTGNASAPEALASGVTVSESSITTTGNGGIGITGTATGGYATGVSLTSASLTTDAGQIQLNGTASQGSATFGFETGLEISQGSLLTNTGAIGLTGTATGSSAYAVSIYNSAATATGSGTIDIEGNANTTSYGMGIDLENSTLGTTTGSITLDGTLNLQAGESLAYGVGVYSSYNWIETASGTVKIDGTVTAATGVTAGGADGVQIVYGYFSTDQNDVTTQQPAIQTDSGAIKVTGSAVASTNGSVALDIQSAAIQSNSGTITLTGLTTGTPASGISSTGVVFESPSDSSSEDLVSFATDAIGSTPSTVTTGTGTLSIYGSGSGSNAQGVLIADGSQIASNNGGTIDIRGVVTSPTTSTSGGNIQYDYGTLIYNGTITATAPNTTISIAGSTNTSDAGLAFGAVPVSDNFYYTSGTVQVNAGPNGTLALRAANDGTATSFADNGATLASSGGTLAFMPASVNPTTFAFTAENGMPITLFGTGAAGLSIDAATYALFSGFSTLVLGSSTQTGLITVSGVCPAQGACTSLTKPNVSQSLTLMNTGSGSQGIQLLYGVSLGSNTLTLASAGAVTDPGGIQAAGLLLEGPGDFTLNDPQNDVGVLAMLNAGNVNFLNSTSFVIGPIVSHSFDAASNAATTIDATNSTLTGNLLAQAATGGIGLGGGTASASGPTGGKNTNLSAGGTVDLVMENGVFTDNGTGSVSATNGWRIWASTWNGETRGNVQPNTSQPNFYGCSYGAGCSWGGVVPLTGDHFVYVARPTVIVTADGAVKVEGAPNPNFGYTTTGLINGDSVSTLSGTLSTNATTGSPPGQYAIDLAFFSNVGYIVQNVPGTLTVTAPVQSAKAPAYDPDLPLAVSAMQSFFGMSEKTFVYENNLQGTNICVGSNQPLFTTAPPGDNQDLLAVEWKRVRSQPNLNSCMLLNGQHGCGDF